MTNRELLRPIHDLEGYRILRRDPGIWRGALEEVCSMHGLDAQALAQIPSGTHIVHRAGDRIIKLFCPLWPEDFISERAALSRASGLPVPELMAEGTLESWRYLVMTVVAGIPAKETWKSLEKEDQVEVLRELGQALFRIHSLPSVPELEQDWNAFMHERAASAVEHNRPPNEEWRRWILDRLERLDEPPSPDVLLHADITDEHVMISDRGGHWGMTGLIDFGDAMMGHPCYDLVAPLCCLCFGNPGLAEVLVESSGLEMDVRLREHVTTLCLLHRYGRIGDFLARSRAETPREFERALFSSWGG
jgi:hygromycin-B 7''-O-kinase